MIAEEEDFSVRCLIIVYSFHHKNTEKIAKRIASVLNAEVTTPQVMNPEELQDYDLIGWGSGIYSARHHESLIDLAEQIPVVNGGNTFLFSTGAMTSKKKMNNDHALLREKLEEKGYTIIDEFQCKGFNTNSFMRFFGGMNKGRPNEEDLSNAEKFARTLEEFFQS
ncbi:MAG: flavodoxin [Candidatus Lokiarchaeota archaeon]|nr:flavodoxin [Candidatus Lokiarchaeota archaeon]